MKALKIMIFFILFFFNSIAADSNYKEITRHSYDMIADEYKDNPSKIKPETKAQRFLSYLPANAKILDLGCGPGTDAKYFVEQGYKVVGIDISPTMIKLAKESVPDAQFFVSDIENISFENNSFDAVWASASLLHLAKQSIPGTLDKIYSILKPDGIIYISMKKGQGKGLEADQRFQGAKKFWNYVEEEELISLLKEHRFQILEQGVYEQSTSYQTHPWLWVISKKVNHP